MPSRENMFLLPGDGSLKVEVPEFKISPCQMEDLVSEIKENLRLTTSPRKAKHLMSRKSSRASPYKVPGRCTEPARGNMQAACVDCMRKRRCLRGCRCQEEEKDPYDVLQKLLRDGNLIQEAVRRVQLGLTPKQRYFYSDSEAEDETCSPVKRYHDATSVQESTRC